MSGSIANALLARLRWPGRESLPEHARPRGPVIARTFIYLYGAGGTLAFTTLLLPHSGMRSSLGVALPAAAAYLVALTIVIGFDRLPAWSFRMLPPLGTALATIVVWSGGPGLMTPYAAFYFWVVLSSFYLFDARWAWVNVAFVGLAFATVLALTPDRPNRAVVWVMLVGALSVGGEIIGLLRARLDTLVAELSGAFDSARRSEVALAEAQRIASIGSWELDLRTRELAGSREFDRILGLGRAGSRRADAVLEHVDPHDRKAMVDAFGKAIEAGGAVELDARARLPDGRRRHLHMCERAERESGRMTKMRGTVEDVTERRDQERRVQGTLRRLAATTEIALALGREREVGSLLRLIAEQTQSLLDAAATAIFVPEGEGFRCVAAVGDSAEFPDLASVPAAGAESARIGDAIAVPLQFRGQSHGILMASGRSGADSFDAADEDMMRAFATSAATAIAGAKTVERERLRRSIEAADRERERWARELHDQTLQGLAMLRMRLEVALEAGEGALAQAARDVLEDSAVEIENLRRIIADLRPAILDQLGLVAALESLASRLRERHRVEVELDVQLGADPAKRLGPRLEWTIFRVVQESLANVGKHARATRARVLVAEDAGAVTVRVQDDGRGFDTQAPSEGFGLSGIGERVRLASGRLAVESGSHGTVVTVVLPVAASGPSTEDRRAAGGVSGRRQLDYRDPAMLRTRR